MFVTAAYAQDAGAAGGAGAALGSFLPLILIFAIMYFLLIRPQQKKVKELKAMIEALRKGDQPRQHLWNRCQHPTKHLPRPLRTTSLGPVGNPK
jgi:hypothetical protein